MRELTILFVPLRAGDLTMFSCSLGRVGRTGESTCPVLANLRASFSLVNFCKGQFVIQIITRIMIIYQIMYKDQKLLKLQ